MKADSDLVKVLFGILKDFIFSCSGNYTTVESSPKQCLKHRCQSNCLHFEQSSFSCRLGLYFASTVGLFRNYEILVPVYCGINPHVYPGNLKTG